MHLYQLLFQALLPMFDIFAPFSPPSQLPLPYLFPSLPFSLSTHLFPVPSPPWACLQFLSILGLFNCLLSCILLILLDPTGTPIWLLNSIIAPLLSSYGATLSLSLSPFIAPSCPFPSFSTSSLSCSLVWVKVHNFDIYVYQYLLGMVPTIYYDAWYTNVYWFNTSTIFVGLF